jgi:glucose/arabinose dehydrogenase
MRTKLLAACLLAFSFIIPSHSNAQVFDQGFAQVLVCAGLTQPTTFCIAPDGRFFIVQQNGIVKVFKNGTLLPQPFITMNVCQGGERGLLGIVTDPQFLTNNWVYMYYTIPGCAFNRVSRFLASGDTVVPNSEQILLDLDTLIAVNHGGGHLEFGPDGKLYIATGENERPYLAHNLDSYLGKILRINPDGTTPADNPFPGPTKRKNVYHYGLRNPFTFEFQPGTGRMFIDDVGDTTWEEINDGSIPGSNFGWPQHEGHTTDTSTVDPLFVYEHGTADTMGCAITGGTFFNPASTNYPLPYQNRYYFIDYCGNWINSISLDTNYTWQNLATNIANYSVCMKTGPDGNLYFLSRNNEAMYKVIYTPDSVPSVMTDPSDQVVSLGFPAVFNAYAIGLPTLTYQWRKNGIDIPGATNTSYAIPAVVFADSGDFDMIVYNQYGSDTSASAHLTVTGNQPPVAVIDTPVAGTLYSGGDTIHYHGTVTDPEDGLLPDSMYAWEVVFHHITHIHPGPSADQGVSSGQFIIPSSGEVSADVWYRLFLYAHDAFGALDTDSVDIYPRTTTFIVATQPTGLGVTVGGQPVQAPDTVLGVEGIIRQIGAPYNQLGYFFSHWSNNGPLDQNFATPVDDTTFTAYYGMPTLPYILPDTIVCVNQQITIDAGAGYSYYVWNDGTMSEFLTLQSAVPDTMTYAVTVTDGNGDIGHDSITVIFDVCDQVLSNKNESIRIYPVPSSDVVNITAMNEDYYLQVTDVTGKIISEKVLVNAHQVKTLHLSEGIYTLRFTSLNDEEIGRGKAVIIK